MQEEKGTSQATLSHRMRDLLGGLSRFSTQTSRLGGWTASAQPTKPGDGLEVTNARRRFSSRRSYTPRSVALALPVAALAVHRPR